jgi:hypothetical protein
LVFSLLIYSLFTFLLLFETELKIQWSN